MSEVQQLLTKELEDLAQEVEGREQLFYDIAKNRYGVLVSVGRQYLVTLNEYSVYFPSTVTNPFYEALDITLEN